MTLVRINKYLASQGVASRRKIDDLIHDKKIKINQKYAKTGDKVDPNQDKIFVDNQPFKPSDKKFIYIVLNKPAGYVTSSVSFKNQPSVLNLVKINQRVFPVGRLDKDTTGLLLLTNDGDLSFKLTHPSYNKPKTYLVDHLGTSSEQLKCLENGVNIGDYITKSSLIKNISKTNFEITITEGKNRQIRRMCESVGVNLTHLKRLSFGSIFLGELQEGCWRYLRHNEIVSLKSGG